MSNIAAGGGPTYTILATLHESDKTIIYRAMRENGAERVVLKVLRADFPSLEQVAVLRREYRLTSNARGEGVVTAYGLERFHATFALVLSEVNGIPLSEAPKTFDLARTLHIGRRLAGTLGRIHERRIIHKNINPTNIIWNPQSGAVTLIDFGIATDLSKEEQVLLNPNGLEGLLPYISPEQTGRMNRTIDYRTDLYSLGVTLYELLTGRTPFVSHDPMELLHGHIAVVPTPPYELEPRVPRIVSAIVERLLAKRAEDRYQNAFSLEADLAQCLRMLQQQGTIEAFPIGRGDVSDVLQISQKLYGRDKEIATLLSAFERAASGGKEMLLVGGYSGIGKSALVHEVHKPIVERRGYFISGKFDQFNRATPYASLIQAVQELVRQILTETAEGLARWRREILDAVGPNAQVIIDVIQEVELVVGKALPVPELSPRETENRFHLTFERFLRSLAAESHPLVCFLDDLQWADLPSLKLFERLITNPETAHLFLIGAYRDNETPPGHPLLVTIEALRSTGITVPTLVLGPLGMGECIELIQDTLRCSAEDARPLAKACLHKTGGNPFFLSQFLLSLQSSGQLRFDVKAGHWRWDIAQILKMDITDNVVDLMASKIRNLPEMAQRALRLAACIGNTFELKTLALISEKTPLDIARDLWPGLYEGLIVPMGETSRLIYDEADSRKLLQSGSSAAVEMVESPPMSVEAERAFNRFLHDRVQQAAYLLTPTEQRSALHLQIGKLLLTGRAEPDFEERLFAVVNHLNMGVDLIGDQNFRDELAALNLAAGRKAKLSAAYSSALEHMKRGIDLLGTQGWERQRETALGLYLGAAETSYLSKNFNEIDAYANPVLVHAGDILNRVKIAELKIQVYNAQNKLGEAVKTALQILKQLGIEFPEAPTRDDLGAAIQEIDSMLEDRTIQSLIELPPMRDQELAAGIRILAMTIPTSYLYDPALFPLIAARQVALSMAHGNTGPSASGYASWGIILGGALGRIEDGYAFGKLALRVLDHYNAKEYQARTEYIVYCFIAHTCEHVRTCAHAFKEVYRTAIDTGDLDFAGYSLVTQATQFFLSGTELGELEKMLASSLQALVTLRHEPALNYTKAIRQVVHNLHGWSADPCILMGEAYNESETLEFHRKANDAYALGSAYLWKLMLCYLFERYAEAEENAEKARAYVGGLVGQYQATLFFLYDALLRLALYANLAPEDQERALAQVEETVRKFEILAKFAPTNHAHKYWMLVAEQNRVLGEHQKAREAYYKAAELARAHDCRNDEALAIELFARFALARGEDEVAQLFMTKARYLYEMWGAVAKVLDLDRRYSSILSARRWGPQSERGGVETPAKALKGAPEALDLGSVLKASQAISGEVVLPALLKSMMHIVLENAGARRGFLILDGEEPLVVAATHDAGTTKIVLNYTPFEQREDLSSAIVRYVQRTHMPVVLGDATAETGPFQTDPYVVLRHPKSILCQAILRQKKLIGILYLENDLAPNVFTPERCRVLDLLSAQAAISIENARLYETLDNRVKERTRELSEALSHLRETQERLVMQEKLASLGMITSGIAHEIKNPLNFINNFSNISMGLADELNDAVGQFRDKLAEDEVTNIEELTGYLKDTAGKIHQHGKRADAIVKAMLAHSRGGSGERELTDINELVQEHVQLAYQGFRMNHVGFSLSLKTSFATGLPKLLIASEEVGRVFQNLAGNACYSMAEKQKKLGSAYAPELSIGTRDTGRSIEIRIRDNGNGMPAAVQEKIFTPFYTTKPPGEGTGLGLSISHSIIARGHGGTLEFRSEEGSFCEFIITLPKESPIVVKK